MQGSLSLITVEKFHCFQKLKKKSLSLSLFLSLTHSLSFSLILFHSLAHTPFSCCSFIVVGPFRQHDQVVKMESFEICTRDKK